MPLKYKRELIANVYKLFRVRMRLQFQLGDALSNTDQMYVGGHGESTE